jgi:DNA replication and repair protein RecF
MITALRLQNFRSYKDSSFEIGPSVNIVVGPNASGKTNLLEAILMAATGRSYRSKDAQLVRFKAPWLRLDALTEQGERIVKLEQGERPKKTFEINQKIYGRLPYDQTLPVVLFEPNDLLLLGGEPERRREFIDNLLEQLIPDYRQLRNRYIRTLRQRNSLLKQGRLVADKQIFAWNIRLSELGGMIASARMSLVDQIDKELGGIYSKLAKRRHKVSARYQSSVPLENYGSALLKLLEQSMPEDIERGFTSQGPHRDDLILLLNGESVSGVASRGETRTLLLGLKMIELRLLEKERGQKPILLLDDVFSELDGARRKALTTFLAPYQTFITTTDADVVVDHFSEQCTIIPTSK